MPSRKSRPRLDTAIRMAEAYRLRHDIGFESDDIAEMMGYTAAHISGNLLNDLPRSERLYRLLKHGRDVFKLYYDDVAAGADPNEDLGLPRVTDMGDYPGDVMFSGSTSKTADAPTSEAARPEYTFLSGDQADAWFRALEAGVEQWVACDCAGIPREAPLAWIREAKQGSEEHNQWLEDCKRISSRAFIRLRERLAQAPKSWRGIDAVANSFVLFNGVDVGKNAADEMREILEQLLPQVEAGEVG